MGTLPCNMLSKYKIIVHISDFLTLEANALYFFEKFRKKMFEETLTAKFQSNTDIKCKAAKRL